MNPIHRRKHIIRPLVLALVLTGAAGVASASSTEAASASCGVSWGSQPTSEGLIGYVPEVLTEGKGDVLALRGGAKLSIAMYANITNVRSGRHGCYDRLVFDLAASGLGGPVNDLTLPSVAGFSTFRQVAYGGSFEGHTTFGLGLRARLPMRVFTLAGPGDGSRLVVDVAHHW